MQTFRRILFPFFSPLFYLVGQNDKLFHAEQIVPGSIFLGQYIHRQTRVLYSIQMQRQRVSSCMVKLSYILVHLGHTFAVRLDNCIG